MSIRRFCGSKFASTANLPRPARLTAAGFGRFSGCRAVLLGSVAFCWLLSGCSQSEYEQALALSRAAPAEADVVGLESVPGELRGLNFSEVHQGAGHEYLGAARLFREVDLFDFLGDYVINIPPGAEFLSGKELDTAMSENWRSERANGTASAAVSAFRHRVLIAAYGASSELWHDYVERRRSETVDETGDGTAGPTELGVLQATFFEALEQCGRNSPWPEVELFVMGDGYAGDYPPNFIEHDSDISAFEYRELLHVCGRYAATYPTLNSERRDELLAPQRARYAQTILDLLDRLLPVVEVPPEYQVEVDELRANGW